MPAPRERYKGPLRKGYVYRLYDSSGNLLYIGKTHNPNRRFYIQKDSHASSKHWWADVRSVTVAIFKTERAALSHEVWAIKRESPRYNQQRPDPWTNRSPKPVHTYQGEL